MNVYIIFGYPHPADVNTKVTNKPQIADGQQTNRKISRIDRQLE